jgi:GTP cyclohydrolase I
MTQISTNPNAGDAAGQTPVDSIPTDDPHLEHVRALLKYIGEDPDREGLRDTPRRVLAAMNDHFRGYREDPAEYLARTFSEVEGYNELVLISDIELHSHCEHHMVPFVGRAHVAYIPDGKVVGLSKIARVVDAYSRRLQVQEKLSAQIAGTIWNTLKPQGVAVILQCQHFCMCYRGVRKPGCWTTTSKLHGCFLSDEASRKELLTLIDLPKKIG